MKLSLGILLAAPLLAYAKCKITFYQVQNWPEAGLWRYRVQIRVYDTPDMWHDLDLACQAYRQEVDIKASFIYGNPLCFGVANDGGSAFADTSVAVGPAGLPTHNALYDRIVATLERHYGRGTCDYEQHSTY